MDLAVGVKVDNTELPRSFLHGALPPSAADSSHTKVLDTVVVDAISHMDVAAQACLDIGMLPEQILDLAGIDVH